MLSIYCYQDYRKFLSDFYLDRKTTDSSYSYGKFSRSAGIRSPNYLALVIEGARNLTTANIQQFAVGLRLRRDETEFFEALVLWNQAKSNLEREYYQDRLKALKRDRPKRIEKRHPVSAIRHWYSIAIMLLANGRNMDQAVKKCQDSLNLPSKDIQSTLNDLLKLGLLIETDDRLEISSQQVTFYDPKSFSQNQERYLYSQLEQSMKAFRRDYSSNQAKFLSHTLTVPTGKEITIHKELISFMERLTQAMDKLPTSGKEELAQINIQIFKPQN